MTVPFSAPTNVTMESINSLTNVTNLAELYIKVNHQVYNDWFFFILLLILWVILYVAFDKSQKLEGEYLVKAMYSGAIITVISLLARAVYIVENGVVLGLLNDFQMWLFPIVTIVIAAILWATKD